MSENQTSTDWRKLREFVAIDLEKSFVLSWELESGALLVDVDLYLMPTHPFYEKPRPAEKVCIRPAVIEFPFCVSVRTGDGPDDAAPGEVTATLGLGAINSLRRIASGQYEIGGEFGLVFVDAERPLLRLKSA